MHVSQRLQDEQDLWHEPTAGVYVCVGVKEDWIPQCRLTRGQTAAGASIKKLDLTAKWAEAPENVFPLSHISSIVFSHNHWLYQLSQHNINILLDNKDGRDKEPYSKCLCPLTHRFMGKDIAEPSRMNRSSLSEKQCRCLLLGGFIPFCIWDTRAVLRHKILSHWVMSIDFLSGLFSTQSCHLDTMHIFQQRCVFEWEPSKMTHVKPPPLLKIISTSNQTEEECRHQSQSFPQIL